MNFNNLNDTFNSLAKVYLLRPENLKHLGIKDLRKMKLVKEAWGAGKVVAHLDDVVDFTGDLLSGKSLFESIEGNEKTLNRKIGRAHV